MNGMKIVDFEKYCKLCKYYELTESEDPCWDCLETPANYESHKPIKFVEAKDNSPKN